MSDENSKGHAFVAFVSQRWAWPAFVLLSVSFKVLHTRGAYPSDAYMYGHVALIATVVFFGWQQLVSGTSSRIYFGVILAVIGIGLFISVGLVVFPLLLLYVIYDLFFKARV